MRAFGYLAAKTEVEAIAAAVPGHRYVAGGTTLLDLMKCGVETPEMLIDVRRIAGLDTIDLGDETLRIGAAARLSRIANDRAIAKACPALHESLRQAASPQLLNMATIGGNLMQRTRCTYFRAPDAFPACNKRSPGSGCAAIGGITRNHAVLGASPHCIASYPGDLAVVLTAFDATLEIGGAARRSVPIADFFRLPGDSPHIEHSIGPGELVIAVAVPLSPAGRRSTYLKVRDRRSYEFAVASVAAGIALAPDGRTIDHVRVALGGIATVPWRAHAVEAALRGAAFDEPTIRAASRHAVEGAVDYGDNAHKIALAPRIVARALLALGSLA